MRGGNDMTTNFDKFRKCYHAALAVVAVGLVLLAGWYVFMGRNSELVYDRWYIRTPFLVAMLMNGMCCVLSLLMWRYSKCPLCGRSVFPFWGSFKTGSRILRSRSVRCAHCGEEVETD